MELFLVKWYVILKLYVEVNGFSLFAVLHSWELHSSSQGTFLSDSL